MPRYDTACKEHGVLESIRSIHDRSPFVCPACGEPAEVVITAAALPAARVDAMSEVRAHDPDPRTRGMNLGLGVPASEASSNVKAREIAKRYGLTPVDSGSYRSLPR